MKSLYEVGDVVKIKRLSKVGNYRHGVNDEMIEVSGETFEIVSVEPSFSSEGEIPDDGFRYKLKDNPWAWASSMFEEQVVKKSTKSKTKTKISFHKNKKLKFDFSL